MKYFGVVPAAGRGERASNTRPKQYAEIAGASMLQHSLRPLLACGRLAAIVVALNPDDAGELLDALQREPVVRIVSGGDTRAQSVDKALNALDADADADDWVLVHDGARPCLPDEDLRRLLDDLSEDPVGGLLAAPIGDTVKICADGRVRHTARREEMARALTPQMFRYGLLRDAMREALVRGDPPADEAEAMERAGHPIRLVAGAASNIKVTYPEDLSVAEAILSRRAGARP